MSTLDKPISQLPAAAALTGTELVPIVQSGVTVQTTAAALAVSGGDVAGPSSATDGNLAVFDGTSGKLVKDGGAVPSRAWDSGSTYHLGNTVLDRGGIWQATGMNTNSQPVSGNADWILVGGLPYIELTLDPTALTSPPFISTAANITAVNQGTKTFTTSAPIRDDVAGSKLLVIGSTGNDGNYTLVSASGNDVVVAEAIPDATGDGQLYPPNTILIPAPQANEIAFPKAIVSITSTGTAWNVQAGAGLGWGDAFGRDLGYRVFTVVPDNLDDSQGVGLNWCWVNADQVVVSTYSSSPPFLNPVPAGSSVVIFNSGVTMTGGTRSQTYRCYYTILPAT